MEALILDKNAQVRNILDTYESFIWTERYNECGDFELYGYMESLPMESIVEGNYVVLSDSNRAMIIESILSESDAENDYIKVTVTGRSLESILTRRVIDKPVTLSGNFQNGIKTLLDMCILSPEDSKRKIERFSFRESTDDAIRSIELDELGFLGENLYDAIETLCKYKNVGFRILLDDTDDKANFIFELYAGIDYSYDQDTRLNVVFSPEYENISSSNYLKDSTDYKNTIFAGGTGKGSKKKISEASTTEDGFSGLDRREVFVDISDIGVSLRPYDSEEDYIPLNDDAIPFRIPDPSVVINGYIMDNTQYGMGVEYVDSSYDDANRATILNYRLSGTLKYQLYTVSGSDDLYVAYYIGLFFSNPFNYECRVRVTDDEGTRDLGYVSGNGMIRYLGKIGESDTIRFTVIYGSTDGLSAWYVADLSGLNFEDYDPEKVTIDEYLDILKVYGEVELDEYGPVETNDGIVDPTVQFVYGRDYTLGDIVQVVNDFGVESKSRITEVVRCDDERGESLVPTFETIED